MRENHCKAQEIEQGDKPKKLTAAPYFSKIPCKMPVPVELV